MPPAAGIFLINPHTRKYTMSDTEIIDLTPENIADYGVCGYKDVRKHGEPEKKSTGSMGIIRKDCG